MWVDLLSTVTIIVESSWRDLITIRKLKSDQRGREAEGTLQHMQGVASRASGGAPSLVAFDEPIVPDDRTNGVRIAGGQVGETQFSHNTKLQQPRGTGLLGLRRRDRLARTQEEGEHSYEIGWGPTLDSACPDILCPRHSERCRYSA